MIPMFGWVNPAIRPTFHNSTVNVFFLLEVPVNDVKVHWADFSNSNFNG